MVGLEVPEGGSITVIVGVGTGVHVGWGVHVGIGVCVGKGVGVGVGVGAGVHVGISVCVGKGVGVGTGVHVGKGVGVGAGVHVGNGVGVGAGVHVGIGGRVDKEDEVCGGSVTPGRRSRVETGAIGIDLIDSESASGVKSSEIESAPSSLSPPAFPTSPTSSPPPTRTNAAIAANAAPIKIKADTTRPSKNCLRRRERESTCR